MLCFVPIFRCGVGGVVVAVVAVAAVNEEDVEDKEVLNCVPVLSAGSRGLSGGVSSYRAISDWARAKVGETTRGTETEAETRCEEEDDDDEDDADDEDEDGDDDEDDEDEDEDDDDKVEDERECVESLRAVDSENSDKASPGEASNDERIAEEP